MRVVVAGVRLERPAPHAIPLRCDPALELRVHVGIEDAARRDGRVAVILVLRAVRAVEAPLQPGQRGVDAEHVEEALFRCPGVVDHERYAPEPVLEDVVREVTRSAGHAAPLEHRRIGGTPRSPRSGRRTGCGHVRRVLAAGVLAGVEHLLPPSLRKSRTSRIWSIANRDCLPPAQPSSRVTMSSPVYQISVVVRQHTRRPTRRDRGRRRRTRRTRCRWRRARQRSSRGSSARRPAPAKRRCSPRADPISTSSADSSTAS